MGIGRSEWVVVDLEGSWASASVEGWSFFGNDD